MKNIHYYIVTLVVLLFMVAPAKAVSEAEFGKLHKTYILHTDGSQEMRVQKELTLFTHTAMNRLYGESFIVYNPEFQELKNRIPVRKMAISLRRPKTRLLRYFLLLQPMLRHIMV